MSKLNEMGLIFFC